MLIRVASYFGKNQLENFFSSSFGKYHLPEPHYNLSPGHELAAVKAGSDANHMEVSVCRWGVNSGNSGNEYDGTVDVKTAKELISKQSVTPCIVPLSGFYMWKNEDENDQPFFVRMMNLPFMPAAAVLRGGAVQLILTRANTLVEPMAAVMPLVLDSDLAHTWIQKSTDLTELAEKARGVFFITDFTVLKISKEVSDPSNNTPALIQPLPK